MFNFEGTITIPKLTKVLSLNCIIGGDWPFLIREALKETASEYGMQANFMSKPLLEQVKCPFCPSEWVWSSIRLKSIHYISMNNIFKLISNDVSK